jgi:hypothetical protein
LAFLAIIGAATVGMILALQWIMVFQLSVLIIANKKRDAEGKKSNEV